MASPDMDSAEGTKLSLKLNGCFSVVKTFDCGQCFRFRVSEDGTAEKAEGTVREDHISLFREKGTDILEVYGLDEKKEQWLEHYLALDEDYDAVDENIIESVPGRYRDLMKEIVRSGKGIRILKQDPWETLISFIISQNNNIPRIKKNVESLSQKYGKKMRAGEEEYYTFPGVSDMSEATTVDLSALKLGFRAKYIRDAIEKVGSSQVSFEKISNTENYDSCEESLTLIKGVGKKVAACTLLFGFGKLEAFPIDVWIKRILSEYFSEDVDPEMFGPYAGIAQEYLYYYARNIGC